MQEMLATAVSKDDEFIYAYIVWYSLFDGTITKNIRRKAP